MKLFEVSVVLLVVALIANKQVRAQQQGCCSQNYLECDVSWISTKSACEADTADLKWLENGALQTSSCAKRWDDCTNNRSGCCPGLICVGNEWYRQCLPGGDNDAGPSPTTTESPVQPTATPAPVSSPTSQPTTPQPITSTLAPVAAPTPNPVTTLPTPAPEQPTTVAPSSGCCSQNYWACDAAWISTKSACEADTADFKWLENGALQTTSCAKRWDACTSNQSGCCPGLVCVGDHSYGQCLPGGDGGGPSSPNTQSPTPSPVVSRTPAPQSNPNSITSPAQSLSVADIQAGLDRYNQLQGFNRLANQELVNDINTVTQGYSLYQQLAFVAQTIWESGGYQFTEEVAATTFPFSTRGNYQDCDWNTPGFQLPPNGKYFYGRGYIQLSWCANYRAYGSARNVDGDPDFFYKNPELVATTYAMDSAAWFFETIVTDNSGQFGLTTRDINGAIECSASYNGNTPEKRYQIFDALAREVGLTGYNANGC
jgi:predicted chitinase